MIINFIFELSYLQNNIWVKDNDSKEQEHCYTRAVSGSLYPRYLAYEQAKASEDANEFESVIDRLQPRIIHNFSLRIDGNLKKNFIKKEFRLLL